MSTHETDTFELAGREVTAYDEPTEGPKLCRAAVTKTFRGEV